MIEKKHLMYAYLPQPLRTIIDICRFEKGPQDLPYSVWMLGAFLAIYTLGRTLVALFTMPAGMAALAGVIDSALLAAIVAAALWVRHLYPRITQTLIACLAVGSVVSLLTIVGYSVVSLSPHPLLRLGVGHALTAPLILWNLALNARILREALSTRITVGFAVAFVYLVILWQITERMVH